MRCEGVTALPRTSGSKQSGDLTFPPVPSSATSEEGKTPANRNEPSLVLLFNKQQTQHQSRLGPTPQQSAMGNFQVFNLLDPK